jgi:dGTPase
MCPKVCESYDWSAQSETARANIVEDTDRPNDARSPFDRDWARIIHSSAFRHLQGKTQIFAPATADYLRTRITHSMEVSQIGRALATRFGVPTTLVEAACLGHDLGHPPFGHTGEHTLNQLMTKHGGFEGNAQSIRIVTTLERKHPDYNGLDLCRGTLLGLIKYPYRRGAGDKYLYDEDAQAYGAWLYEDTGHSLLDAKQDDPPRTIAAQLMDWSDDIAYSVHDLEDGILSGYLQPTTWQSDKFLSAIHESIRRAPIKWQKGPPPEQQVAGYVAELYDWLSKWGPDIPMDVIREMSRHYIDDFARACDVEVLGDAKTSFDFRLTIPEDTYIHNQVLKAITFEFIIRDPRTVQIFHKGEHIIRRLFDELFENASDDAREDRFLLFPRDLRDRLKVQRDNQSALARFVCDHIASMTEGQALRLYARLFEPFSATEGTLP